LFFLAQVQHGGGGWSANVFLTFAKSVTEKDNEAWTVRKPQKNFASHEVRMVRVFWGWGLPCGAAHNLFSGEIIFLFVKNINKLPSVPQLTYCFNCSFI
jgi:hypothetical protein